MPIPRTRTMAMHDFVLRSQLASATTAETVRVVSPVAGFVERVFAIRAGAHSSTEALTLTVNGNGQVITLATAGGAGDVDEFELGRNGDVQVPAGGVISILSTGTPTQTTPVALVFVVRGQ